MKTSEWAVSSAVAIIAGAAAFILWRISIVLDLWGWINFAHEWVGGVAETVEDIRDALDAAIEMHESGRLEWVYIGGGLLVLLCCSCCCSPGRRSVLSGTSLVSPPPSEAASDDTIRDNGWDLSNSESEKASQAALMAEVSAVAGRLEAMEKERRESASATPPAAPPPSSTGATAGSGSSSASVDYDRMMAGFLRRIDAHAEAAKRDSGQLLKAAGSADPAAPGASEADSGAVRELIAGLSSATSARPPWRSSTRTATRTGCWQEHGPVRLPT